jgi:beta-N-acetylhexosaminidase
MGNIKKKIYHIESNKHRNFLLIIYFLLPLLLIVNFTACKAVKESYNDGINQSTNENNNVAPSDSESLDNKINTNSDLANTGSDKEENTQDYENDSSQIDLSQDTSVDQSLDKQIQQKLSKMTLEEKVAQLFIITPEALTGYKTVVAAGDVTRDALKKYPVGGIVYFRQNIVDPVQLKTMTKNTRNYVKEMEGLPLFFAIDEEGGTVARIGKNNNFDVKTYTDMTSIGATKDLKKAYEVGATIGAYLKEYGLNLDFAPDTDVLTNPNNKVIGNRSFGNDGNLVANMGLEVAKGLSDHSILSCFKHFPGHGATEGDTHEGFAYTDKTLKELERNELIPFQVAAENDIPFIMISHISVPKVIGDNTPSSLSKTMVTDILRDQLDYKGIIITDSMSMGAIVNTYGSKEAVIKALEAGVDMILMPQNFKESYAAVLKAIEDGVLSEERIDESLIRILRIKLTMKINN